jgi:uncharacterized protein (TIGR03083 family)
VPDVTSDRPSLDVWLSAANHSHRRLVDAVGPLSAEQINGPSYDEEWSIAQVLSHLGSSAEIFSMFLRAGRRHEPGPGMDEFTPVWDRWNAKAPEAQVAEALVADRQFLDEMHALDEHDRRNWAMALFGADQKLVDLMQFRLSEHAVHTWDVVVMADEGAAIAPDATALLVDTLAPLVARVGASTPDPLRVQLHTHDPDRHFLLVAGGDGAELGELAQGTAPGADEAVELPAEALIRLFYGRLDPGHTPESVGGDFDIDALRRIFTGF